MEKTIKKLEKVYISKAHKTYVYCIDELSESEQQERTEKAKKLRFALKKRDEEDYEEYCTEHANGYCPICGMLLPLNGICGCGYNVHTDTKKPIEVEGVKEALVEISEKKHKKPKQKTKTQLTEEYTKKLEQLLGELGRLCD